MSTINSNEIISILKEKIVDFDFSEKSEEVGTVISVGDGIATIYGMEHVMYGEIVVFENGVKGMIQDIKRNQVGCILFGDEAEIHEGTKVRRTRKKAGVPVGDAFVGRVVNALCEPIDGEGEIQSDDYRMVENAAPSIVDRKSVSEPLETGILAIDSMFPIGRGQRELIIGDRQTGKTSIALDTILNQKGKNCICIYNAIGQKTSTVAKLVNTLKKSGAMDYAVVVCSGAADSASLQYIAPYAATALAEYFMYQGKDVLIVYDDLSKHAVAYRALSLLLERSPGREAYPGDVFYLHSRLLERSSRLSDELGGGSITALPIIETQAGDVSAYIPTNVISITDGQIFLESDLFFSGQRPAVNVGLSVSRVGGAAQTKAMKKAAGSLRVDLAQFREMEVFTQFSSDLDEETKSGLNYGKGLMELLKQPLGHPMSLADQVITLVGAIGKKFVQVPADELKAYQAELLAYFNDNCADVVQEIQTKKTLSDELKEKILKDIDSFGRRRMANAREILDRMKSIKDTMKITNAMYMVSSSKLQKARRDQKNTEPYFNMIQDGLAKILDVAPDAGTEFFDERPQRKGRERRKGFLVITADKGLAGAYNHNVIKATEESAAIEAQNMLFIVGQVGRHYFEKKNIPIDINFKYTAQNPTMNRARHISKILVNCLRRKS